MKVEQWIWNMVRVRVKVEYNESETLWIWNTVIVKPNESENCEFESGTQWKLNTMRVKLPTSSSRGLVVPSESQWAAVKNKNQSINQMSSCKNQSDFQDFDSTATCKASSVGRVSGLQARWKTCFLSSTFLSPSLTYILERGWVITPTDFNNLLIIEALHIWLWSHWQILGNIVTSCLTARFWRILGWKHLKGEKYLKQEIQRCGYTSKSCISCRKLCQDWPVYETINFNIHLYMRVSILIYTCIWACQGAQAHLLKVPVCTRSSTSPHHPKAGNWLIYWWWW